MRSTANSFDVLRWVRVLGVAAGIFGTAVGLGQTVVNDDFARADAALDGDGWTVHSGEWRIDGGALHAGPAAVEQHAYVGAPPQRFNVVVIAGAFVRRRGGAPYVYLLREGDGGGGGGGDGGDGGDGDVDDDEGDDDDVPQLEAGLRVFEGGSEAATRLFVRRLFAESVVESNSPRLFWCHGATYRFVPGVATTSLAQQTAQRLGVTRDQLRALIRRTST